MILYFSGTGNTRYIANLLAERIGEETVDISSASPNSLQMTGKSLGIMFPVHSWGVPPIMMKFLENLNQAFIRSAKEKYIWTVMTCGDDTGLTSQMLNDILSEKGLDLKGIWSVIMPNTYVTFPGFDVDKPDVEKRKVKAAECKILEISEHIHKEERLKDVIEGSFPRFKSKVIYPFFWKYLVNPAKFKVSEKCIGCEKCAKVCPTQNINLMDHRPHWGDRCTGCLACYHICPVKAISYGKFTKRKGQYFCRLLSIQKYK